jgi:hypothetical protein
MKINQNTLNKIQEATDLNAHFFARHLVCEAIKAETNIKAIIATYKYIDEQHKKEGFLPVSLSALRYEMDKLLKEHLFEVVENCDQVWNAL